MLNNRIIIAPGGSVGAILGVYDIFGTSTGSETVTVFDETTVTLQPDFNRGGDTVRLRDVASDFQILRAGSNVVLTSVSDAVSVTVPVGIAGLKVVFENSAGQLNDERTLLFNGTNVVLGNQVIGFTASQVLSNLNTAPVITSAASITIDENAPASDVVYRVTATDPDAGQTLTYSLAGTDAALFTINSATGEVRLRQSANFEAKQSYAISVQASDGVSATARAVTLTVRNVVDQLDINGGGDGSISAVDARGTAADLLDVNYRFIEQVADANDVLIVRFTANDVLSFDSALSGYSFSNTGADLIISQNVNAVISRIVIQNIISQTQLVFDAATANAALNQALGTSNVSYLTTSPGTPNAPPVVANSIPDQVVAEDTAWSYSFPANSFSDPDSSRLSFEAGLSNGQALPSWLSFNGSTRTFNGTPPLNFNGNIDLRVAASDGTASVNDDFRLTVTPVNDAPVVASVIADQSLAEDSVWSYQVPANTFSDADGNTLTYTASLASGAALPSWLTFNAATRTFSGTPPLNFNGNIDLRVAASDGTASVNDDFRLTVTPVNDAPVVASVIADQSLAEDSVWSYQVPANTFSDADGNTLTYTASLASGAALPSWLTFSAATRTFSGTPPLNFNGNIDLRVTASDGTISARDEFRLTVTPVNDPATIPTFAAPITYNLGGADRFAIGNINGDKNPDLIIHSGVNNLSLFFGNRNGQFTFSRNISIPFSAVSLNLADINNDGTDDIVAASNSDGQVAVLLSNGVGSYGSARTFLTAPGHGESAIVDFNNDGWRDLAVASTSGTVTFAINDRNGWFSSFRTVSTASGSGAIGAGDFNQDGFLDVVTSNYPNSVSILTNNGSGQFSVTQTIANGAWATTVGDFNSDGRPDIVSAQGDANSVDIIINNWPNPISRYQVPVGNMPGYVATSDLNLDGYDDVVIANQGAAIISILINNQQNGFVAAPGLSIPSSLSYIVRVQDLNSDGLPDIVVSNVNANSFSVFLQATGASLPPANSAPIVANAIADRSLAEDTAWSYVVPANTFSDADGNTLTYSASLASGTALPAWLTFNGSTRTFNGTPPLNFNGNIDLRVTASDGALSTSDTFRLTVTPVNDAPFITSYGGINLLSLEVPQGIGVFGRISATDPDAGSNLTYFISGGVDAARFTVNSVTGALRFNSDVTYSSPIDQGRDGTYDVTLSASDGSSSVEQRFSVTVGPPGAVLQVPIGRQSTLGTIVIAGDDGYNLFFNGVKKGEGTSLTWTRAETYSLNFELGKNVIGVLGINNANGTHPGAIIAQIDVSGLTVGSSKDWIISTNINSGWLNDDFVPKSFRPAIEYGNVASEIWFNSPTNPGGLKNSGFPIDSDSKWIWSEGFRSDSQVQMLAYIYLIPEFG